MVIWSLEHVDFITGKWWCYLWKMWILSLEHVDFITGQCGFYHWTMGILSLEHGDVIIGKWGFYHWKVAMLSLENGDNHLKFPDFIMGDFKPSIVSGYRHVGRVGWSQVPRQASHRGGQEDPIASCCWKPLRLGRYWKLKPIVKYHIRSPTMIWLIWLIIICLMFMVYPDSTCWLWLIQHVPRNPLVRPHSNNTSKQYDILITRGWMKTLAIRSDFDFKFAGFRVLI